MCNGVCIGVCLGMCIGSVVDVDMRTGLCIIAVCVLVFALVRVLVLVFA